MSDTGVCLTLVLSLPTASSAPTCLSLALAWPGDHEVRGRLASPSGVHTRQCNLREDVCQMVYSTRAEGGQSSEGWSSLEHFLEPGGLRLHLQGQVRPRAQKEGKRTIRRRKSESKAVEMGKSHGRDGQRWGLNCQLEEMGLAGTGGWELWWALELRSQRWRRVFIFFNFSITLDSQCYIHFRFQAERLGIYVMYEVIPLISLVLTWHYPWLLQYY